MLIQQLSEYLDRPGAGEAWLRGWGVEDVRRAHDNLSKFAATGVTLDLLATSCDQLGDVLPGLSDPDRALNNLERFFAASRNPLSLATLFERDADALGILLQIFSSSQHFSDVLVLDSESYDLLRVTQGQPSERDALVDELATEIDATTNEQAALAT